MKGFSKRCGPLSVVAALIGLANACDAGTVDDGDDLVGAAGSGGDPQETGGNSGGPSSGGQKPTGGTTGLGGEGGHDGAGGDGGASGGSVGGMGGAEQCDVDVGTGADDLAFGEYCVGCTRTKIGEPTWAPTGVVVSMGDTSTGPSFTDWVSSWVGPNHIADVADFMIVPSAVHCPPYASELYDELGAAGILPKQTFGLSEYAPPSGVVITLVLVPTEDAPTGSSFEYEAGPIIPNGLFPMNADGDLYREGALYDSEFDSTVLGYDELSVPIDVDGPSHAPLFYAENSSFGPVGVDPDGAYDFKLVVTDTTEAGWEVHVPFVVEPD